MSQSRPLTVAEWRDYLGGYSAEFLDSGYVREAESGGRAKWIASPAQRAAGWLGYKPTSERMLAETEIDLASGCRRKPQIPARQQRVAHHQVLVQRRRPARGRQDRVVPRS
jgi:hypothetical protein